MKKGIVLRLFTAVMALALFGAACSSGADSGNSADSTNDDTKAVSAVDDEASTLNRDLTALLVEHEYLAGIALSRAIKAGGDLKAADVEAGVAALDHNTKALGAAIGSVYGAEGEKTFLDLWRKHIGFFVNYTLGTATGDKAMAKSAKADLDGYRKDFGAFIEAATEGTLPGQAVTDALKPHVATTIEAIDSLIAFESGTPKGDPFQLLKKAASHMPHIATALAGGIAQHQGLKGTADSGASALQGTLTAGLVEHEYLAGIALTTAVEAGGDLKDPAVAAAVGALDANTVDLGAAIGSIYGAEGEKTFLDLWRKHIGFFVNYTLGTATGDKAMAKKAKANLDGYRTDFGAFIEAATEGALPGQAVTDALKPHVDKTLTAIDSVVGFVSGKPQGNPFDLLREAASHMPHIATALAGGILTQKPELAA